MGNKVTETVASLAEPIMEELGLELIDVEYVREGANWYLRVFIDKEGGVTLSDCEAAHKPLSSKLDEVDPISRAYILEVSSPGVERPFKKARDYEKAIGHKVRVGFFKSIDGVKAVEGVLVDYDGQSVTISTGEGEIKTYPLEAITKMNRMILF